MIVIKEGREDIARGARSLARSANGHSRSAPEQGSRNWLAAGSRALWRLMDEWSLPICRLFQECRQFDRRSGETGRKELNEAADGDLTEHTQYCVFACIVHALLHHHTECCYWLLAEAFIPTAASEQPADWRKAPNHRACDDGGAGLTHGACVMWPGRQGLGACQRAGLVKGPEMRRLQAPAASQSSCGLVFTTAFVICVSLCAALMGAERPFQSDIASADTTGNGKERKNSTGAKKEKKEKKAGTRRET